MGVVAVIGGIVALLVVISMAAVAWFLYRRRRSRRERTPDWVEIIDEEAARPRPFATISGRPVSEKREESSYLPDSKRDSGTSEVEPESMSRMAQEVVTLQTQVQILEAERLRHYGIRSATSEAPPEYSRPPSPAPVRKSPPSPALVRKMNIANG
jgi:hypothetical protein